MREILFRGKRDDFVEHKHDGEWIEGGVFKIGDKTLIMSAKGEMRRVYPETVGQFTGLTDKNGNKIFEGDICNISIPRIDGGFNRHNKCLCFYEDGMYKFSSYSDIYFCMGNGYGYPDTCHQNIEVIGNIHDNPELIGGAQ